jgi:hypothetical protein
MKTYYDITWAVYKTKQQPLPLVRGTQSTTTDIEQRLKREKSRNFSQRTIFADFAHVSRENRMIYSENKSGA